MITKTRLVLFLVFFALWSAIYHSFLIPASTVARQSIAVGTVNSSTGAYIAQQAVENGAHWSLIYPLVIVIIGLLCFLTYRQPKS